MSVVEGMMISYIKRFFIAVWKNDTDPSDWLGKTNYEYTEYSEPVDDGWFFGKSYGYSTHTKGKRTWLGSLVEKSPGIVALPFLIVYHTTMWPLWCIITFIIMIVKLVIQLLTRRWEDIDTWEL